MNSILNIKSCITSDITEKSWGSYIKNFNLAFDRNFSFDYFQNKYKLTCDNHSYHAFLMDEHENVVGACTFIPYVYSYNNSIIRLALAVDLFVLQEYRQDIFVFLKLYQSLKALIKKRNITGVIAVPNKNSYSLFKNLAKFKDIGELKYWVLPTRMSKLYNLPIVFDIFSFLYSRFLININFILALFIDISEKKVKFHMDLSPEVLKSRFGKDYLSTNNNLYKDYYRIYKESNITVAYLLLSHKMGKTNYKSIVNSSRKILKENKDVDLISYIGTLRVFQILLFRIPRFVEPQKLILIGDLLDHENNKDIKLDFYNIKNWDFGLINFDAR